MSKIVSTNKLTVPQLKEQLRAMGLKVSGRKKELIDRLSDAGVTSVHISVHTGQIGVPSVGVQMKRGDLSKLTVPQLKEQLRARGLPVSGRKKELINRLAAYDALPPDVKMYRAKLSDLSWEDVMSILRVIELDKGIISSSTLVIHPNETKNELIDRAINSGSTHILKLFLDEPVTEKASSPISAFTGPIVPVPKVITVRESATSLVGTPKVIAARKSPGRPPSALPSTIPTDRVGLSKLTVKQLKQILRDKGLKVSGKKSELIERILGAPSVITEVITDVMEVTEYDKYTQPELLHLVQNLYGETLPSDMRKKDIIEWLQVKTSVDQTLAEKIIGPGPQMGALSPVITSPISFPPIPGIVPSDQPVFFQAITSPLPDISGLTIRDEGEIKLVPKEKEEDEEELVTFPSVITDFTVQLPPLTEVKLPGITDKLPEVPIPPHQMAISPKPIGPTGVIVSGVLGGTLELPDISGDMGPQMVEVTETGEIVTGIDIPLISTVIPSQSIKLPPARFPSKGKEEEEEVELPPIVTFPPKAQEGKPLGIGKVGAGGLPIETDLATLNRLRTEVETAGVNPRAFFQRKIPAKLPPSPVKEKEEITTLPPMTVGLPTELPPITMELPTKKVTKTTQPIHMPKMKITAPFPGELVIPKFTFPMQETVMKPIPLVSPTVTTEITKELAVAYTPEQQVIQNIMNIDPKRLNPRRAKKGDNSYTVTQLRSIAGSLNLPKSGNKKELVNRVKAAIRKVKPDVVFEQ